MFLTIYAAGMPFNGDTIPSGKSLGGSESAAYYMAKELAKMHTVTVFTSHQEGGRWDNVQYEWHGEQQESAPLGVRFAFAMRAPQDIVIVQRHPKAFDVPPNSKMNIWWLHDLALHRNADACKDSLANTDKIFCVSEFHKKQVCSVYGIAERNVIATKNGVDYDQINKAIEGIERKKKQLCFASRPERGLEILVEQGGIMEQLPEYSLKVCGYDNTTPQMKVFYDHLHERCEALPNVEYLGALGKDRLYQLLAQSEVYIYPTMFEDTSNIMAMEAAACGTPFIGMKISALPETCEGGFAALIKPENGKVSIPKMVSAVKLLCETHGAWEKKNVLALQNNQPWTDIALEWNEIFEQIFSAKTDNTPSLLKHFEQMSDVIAMRECATDNMIERCLPGFTDNYSFLLNDDFKNHYEKYYEYEKNRGVEYGPESMDGNPRFECIFEIVKNLKPKTVLDYGCAHGHYTINMAKRLPGVDFIGCDLAQSNIEIAEIWTADEKLDNVSFKCGQHTYILDKYDLIIAAEVLEHVEDPQEIIDTLNNQLNPGGTMLISVPYGPWEAQGYDQHKGWRAHIHHLERQDLKEMFGHFNDYKCMALPHSGNLGHYVVSFKHPGGSCGAINYNRKISQQAPLQTVSVCMIARNEQSSLGRCLDSVKFADEIIIGIDENTTDDTARIAEKYGAECFYLKSPLDIGFSEARNLVIEDAKSDWILWIDADETLENADLLQHYLRQNIYDGYLIQQHHYSAEPAAILQTDFPCRLFRNNRGIKFFGWVHEHPSIDTDMNAGPGKVYMIPNVHIMHTGYATEAKRRKRFARNFPLLKIDRGKNPDRLLGKFLFVRDLAHFVRYDLEQNRGNVTNESYGAAQEAIELWKELLEDGEGHTRFVIDSLPYFSECVNIITQGAGLKFKGRVNGYEIEGLFDHTNTVKELMKTITNSSLKIYSEKYY